MTTLSSDGLRTTLQRLDHLLERARQKKPTAGIEPPLAVSDFTGDAGLPFAGRDRILHYTLVELASRQKFHELASNGNFTTVQFNTIWNLLDILAICGDQAQCDPVLVWWLIEELLESQDIEGCRVVFDYLDSRRDRLVLRDLQKKELVILRSFNELLRRLSRAEDAVFCGRVLIYLSQTFVLGTRGTTNNRGEFNSSNVTTFEVDAAFANDELPDAEEASQTLDSQLKVEKSDTSEEIKVTGSTAPSEALDTKVLYSIFWSLQQAFSNPPSVLEKSELIRFKAGLEATVSKFKDVPKVVETSKSEARTAPKRSADAMEEADVFSGNFNPKYLTSRDLFRLELSDLAFQRDILVQALILLEFMLSLTEEAKESAAKSTQNKLQYQFTLSEEDAAWAKSMKTAITDYLSTAPDGKQYLRMVDTVLSRDKNWIRWKMEACPEISRKPISAQDYERSKQDSKKLCATRRLRSAPMGALDLRFLSENDNSSSLDRLQAPERFMVPKVETLVKQIEITELDLEMAAGDELKRLESTRDSQTWGVLRCAVRSAYTRLGKIEDGRNLRGLLISPAEAAGLGEGSPLPVVVDAGVPHGGGGNAGDVPRAIADANGVETLVSGEESGQAGDLSIAVE